MRRRWRWPALDLHSRSRCGNRGLAQGADGLPVLAAMTTGDIARAIGRMYAELDTIRNDLNAADRMMGDGDTGMTVADVATAWYAALANEYDSASALLLGLGRETRRATGSSLGSVMGIGLSAAGRSGAVSVVEMLDAATSAITERSGASPGDKTILDSLIAIRESARERRGPDRRRATCARRIQDAGGEDRPCAHLRREIGRSRRSRHARRAAAPARGAIEGGHVKRRDFLQMAAGATLLSATPARAQADWPSRNIRLVIPFPPGEAATSSAAPRPRKRPRS